MRIFFGILILACGLGSGFLLLNTAYALADTFPAQKTFGQNAVLFGMGFVGLSSSALLGAWASHLLFRRKS